MHELLFTQNNIITDRTEKKKKRKNVMQYRQQRSVISTLTNDNSLLIGITGNINDENRSFRVICNVSFSLFIRNSYQQPINNFRHFDNRNVFELKIRR